MTGWRQDQGPDALGDLGEALVAGAGVGVHGELRRRVPQERLRLLDRGANLDDEGRVGDAAGVEVELALGRALGDAGPDEILVELAGRVARNVEEGLAGSGVSRDGEEPIEERLRQRLEARLAVFGPRGLEPEASEPGVEVRFGDLAELVGPEASAEGRLVEEAPLVGRDGQEPLNLLARHGPALLARCDVEPAQTLEGIFGEVAALDAPVTERGQRLGRVHQRLARTAAITQLAQRLLDARQAIVEIAERLEAERRLPVVQVARLLSGVAVGPRPAAAAALGRAPGLVLAGNVGEVAGRVARAWSRTVAFPDGVLLGLDALGELVCFTA